MPVLICHVVFTLLVLIIYSSTGANYHKVGGGQKHPNNAVGLYKVYFFTIDFWKWANESSRCVIQCWTVNISDLSLSMSLSCWLT